MTGMIWLDVLIIVASVCVGLTILYGTLYLLDNRKYRKRDEQKKLVKHVLEDLRDELNR